MCCGLMWRKLFCFCCDELKIKINYLLGDYMLICRAAGFIYKDEGSELAKSLCNSVNCLDAFDFQGDYRFGEAFLGGC